MSPANRRRAVHCARWARRAGAAVAAGAIALFLPMPPTSAQTVSIRMASKNFPGAQVLSQLYGQALASQGAHVTFADAVGATEVVFPALQAGTFDAYADYQGTLLTYLGGTPTASSAKTHAALLDKLRGTGLTVSDAAPAVDVNGFYVTRSTARKYRLSKVSDLRRVAPRLKIGAPPECASRPLCLGDASRRVYGLEFRDVVPIDPNGREAQRSLRRGDVDVAVLFTGSSVIPKDTVLLKDDKGLQGADNPLVLLREDKSTPELTRDIDKVSAKITTRDYRRMTLAVTNDKEDADEVAKEFVDNKKL